MFFPSPHRPQQTKASLLNSGASTRGTKPISSNYNHAPAMQETRVWVDGSSKCLSRRTATLAASSKCPPDKHPPTHHRICDLLEMSPTSSRSFSFCADFHLFFLPMPLSQAFQGVHGAAATGKDSLWWSLGCNCGNTAGTLAVEPINFKLAMPAGTVPCWAGLQVLYRGWHRRARTITSLLVNACDTATPTLSGGKHGMSKALVSREKNDVDGSTTLLQRPLVCLHLVQPSSRRFLLCRQRTQTQHASMARRTATSLYRFGCLSTFELAVPPR